MIRFVFVQFKCFKADPSIKKQPEPGLKNKIVHKKVAREVSVVIFDNGLLSINED